MSKKYELTDESIIFHGIKLFRIKALIDFSDVKAGDLGGYIEKEENLSHCSNCWVYGDAKINSNLDYTTIKGFGSCQRTTTFFRCKDGLVRVACGYFYGTIAEFRNIVRETHGNSKYAEEYLMIADLMEKHFAE